ncbi:MAG TPA: PilZ domain-containing protein [Sphingomicrobium sp.]
MTGTSSVTTFIVGDRLPWPDESAPARGPFDAGAIYDAASRHDCAIRKISALGATVRAELKKVPGDPVSIELGTGQRPAGKIAWIVGSEAGVSFNQPVDLLALINRSLINQPAERRTMPRVEIRCAIHIKAGGAFDRATMRNISANGLQIEGEDLPPRGTFVSVFVEGLVVPAGEIVWRKDKLAGIELFEELSWTSIVPWLREMMRKGAQ